MAAPRLTVARSSSALPPLPSLEGSILDLLHAKPQARPQRREIRPDVAEVRYLLKMLAAAPSSTAPSPPAGAGAGRPAAPVQPSAPVVGQLFDALDEPLVAIARLIVLKSTLFKYAPNPNYNLLFMNPDLLMPPQPMPPLSYRNPGGKVDEYYHTFGDFGDYGYENQGNSGYGCGHGGCAPWWFSWTKNKGAYYPFVHRTALM